METVKLLPQLFYDVISRVIPGVIALVLVSHAVGRDLGGLVVGPFAGAPALRDSALFLGIATVGAAYIAGQVLSPASDLYERWIVGRFVPARYWVFPAALAPDSPYPAAMRRFLRHELAPDGAAPASPAPYRAAVFVWYDWLRVWNPEAGMRVTKLRAEYRMFGGIGVAALGTAALHAAGALAGAVPPSGPFLGSALLVGAFTTWGMVRTLRTFEQSVMNQYYVARTAVRLPASPAPIGVATVAEPEPEPEPEPVREPLPAPPPGAR